MQPVARERALEADCEYLPVPHPSRPLSLVGVVHQLWAEPHSGLVADVPFFARASDLNDAIERQFVSEERAEIGRCFVSLRGRN